MIYSSTILDTKYGDVKINYHQFSEGDCMTLIFGDIKKLVKLPILVRLQSSCLFSQAFHTIDCDCNKQLEASFKLMSEKGGVIVYIEQEGRGIGLKNKIKSMEYERVNKVDTEVAFKKLFDRLDYRNYDIVGYALKELGIRNVKLITSNPDKIKAIEKQKIKVIEIVKLNYDITPKIKRYLEVKKEKFNYHI